MFKCDDYESRLDMYKENQLIMDMKLKKRKTKVSLIVEEKRLLQEKVDEQKVDIEEMQSQIKKFQKESDPERKRIIMVKKPIFDASGNQIGEGLVEQVVTMRTDESLNYLQSIQHSNVLRSEIGDDDLSHYSLDSQERADLENFLKE